MAYTSRYYLKTSILSVQKIAVGSVLSTLFLTYKKDLQVNVTVDSLVLNAPLRYKISYGYTRFDRSSYTLISRRSILDTQILVPLFTITGESDNWNY